MRAATVRELPVGAVGSLPPARHANWFTGIQRLPIAILSSLGVLSPLVATIIGWIALGQTLTPVQTGATAPSSRRQAFSPRSSAISSPRVAVSLSALSDGRCGKEDLIPGEHAATVPTSPVDLLQRAVPAVLVTVMPDGRPQASVVWVAYRDGLISLNTEAGGQAVRDIHADPRITGLTLLAIAASVSSLTSAPFGSTSMDDRTHEESRSGFHTPEAAAARA